MPGTETIRLRLINETDSPNPSGIVVLDKSVLPAVAWRVFDFSPMVKSLEFKHTPLEINAWDEYGNYTLLLPAAPGDAFRMADSPSGHVMEWAGEADLPEAIEVSNEIRGPIGVFFYRDKKLFAEKIELGSGKKASIVFGNSIWLGALKGVLEGQQLKQGMEDRITAEFSLEGVVSADILVLGGAGEYWFEMVNVVEG